MRTPLLVVGDALLDIDLCGAVERLAPDAPVPVVDGLQRLPRPGGAALAACLAAADGRRVTLVTALGTGASADTLRRLLAGRVRLVEIPLKGTLCSKTRVLSGEHPLLRLDDGDGRADGAGPEALAEIAEASAILVSDYGRGTAEVLREPLAEAAARRPMVWDPHPRGGPPVAGTRLATPSAAEALRFADGDHTDEGDLAGELVRRWHAASVAVTLGDRGAVLSCRGEPLLVPAPTRATGDPCAAGDRLAATAAGLLADGALPETAVRGGVAAATDFVVRGGARAFQRQGSEPGLDHRPEQPASPFELAAGVRAGGGRWSPPAAASTSSTPATSPCWRRPGRPGTA